MLQKISYTNQNRNLLLTALAQTNIAHNAPFSSSLPPLISADEFLESAPKIRISGSEPLPSDVLSVNQLLGALLPSPEDNAVITALKTLGLYKKSAVSGKHEITCPWCSEHTNAKDSGTAYFESNDDYPTGGFKCLHSHCSKRKIWQLLAYLEISIAEVMLGAK